MRALRQTTGLSQEAFADRCGFARSYMSRIERGKGNPSLDAVEVLAVALGIDVHELFINDQPTPTARKQAIPLRVPYAADGTCFHPGLRMRRTNQYRVGPTGAERDFSDFQEALTYLSKMKTASWRRPNPAGNWGIVKAVRWDDLKKQD